MKIRIGDVIRDSKCPWNIWKFILYYGKPHFEFIGDDPRSSYKNGEKLPAYNETVDLPEGWELDKSVNFNNLYDKLCG